MKHYHASKANTNFCIPTYFSLKIIISGEISKPWGPAKKACIEIKRSLQSRDNHGYCGTFMIGGDIRHDVPPPNFLVGGTHPPSPPVAEPMPKNVFFHQTIVKNAPVLVCIFQQLKGKQLYGRIISGNKHALQTLLETR